MKSPTFSYNQNIFIIVQALLWIWEIQGPQNLGFVQKLSLTFKFASRSKETKVPVSCQRPSDSARATCQSTAPYNYMNEFTLITGKFDNNFLEPLTAALCQTIRSYYNKLSHQQYMLEKANCITLSWYCCSFFCLFYFLCFCFFNGYSQGSHWVLQLTARMLQ